MKFKLFLILYFLLLVVSAAWLARKEEAKNLAPATDNKVTQIRDEYVR